MGTGAAVGTDDGSGVGDGVGMGTGAEVGTDVGMGTGAPVGLPVGMDLRKSTTLGFYRLENTPDSGWHT